LSNNTSLDELDVSSNDLTLLDLSNLNWLIRLNVDDNRFPNQAAVSLRPGLVWGGNIHFGTQRTP
jgi:hypothetical protein